MPEFEINMGDIPTTYSRLDTNLLYILRIDNVEVRRSGQQSRNPGEPYLAVTMSVRLPAEWEGRVVFDNLNFPHEPTPLDSVSTRRQKHERGIRLRQYMDAFELPWTAKGFKTEYWIGHEAGATMRDEEGQDGEMRTRVRKYITSKEALAAMAKLPQTPDGGPTTGGTDTSI